MHDFPRCEQAVTLTQACEGLADDLLDAGFEMPSVYLLSGPRLRCRAARGYFQVLDGFRPGVGVIGEVVATGACAFIPDVSRHPGFIGADPGIAAEACCPVRLDGRVVGAVSLESTTTLAADALAVLERAAAALARAVARTGGLPQPSLSERVAHVAVELTTARTVRDVQIVAARAAAEISGMSTAAIVSTGHAAEPSLHLAEAVGPLAERLRGWSRAELALLTSPLGIDTSSHHPGCDVSPPAYEFLRRAEVASISVHPMAVAGRLTGYLLLASDGQADRPAQVVDCLELLAAQTAAALHSATMVEELSHRAERDELTGLGNRTALVNAVNAHLGRLGAGAGRLSLLLLDLDDFKHVNDHLGHHVGDRLLIEVAEAIRGSLRDGDVACRLGGDEFAVLLPGAGAAAATAAAERILVALRALAPVEGAHLQTSASIGVVESDAAEASPGQLLKVADLAMYLAKDRGKGQWALFEPGLQQAAAERLSLESDLRSAVRRRQLHLVFQPIVDITTAAMTAVEALARWHHPVRGPVSPGVFIPLAEQTGLIIPLGEWVLREACAQMQRWTLAGADPTLRITVNLSTRQLDQPSLLVALDECLDQCLDPSRLILEITESALADDDRRAADALSAIRERGVHLAVDDFGTGYSSLSRLGASPISRLKIDRSFISAITSADAHVPLVEATMAMATGLGLGVVAEGVETLDQLAHLRSLNCPEVQGFLFSRPLSSVALQPLLDGERPWQSLVEQAALQAQARPIGLASLVELASRAEVTLEELAGPLLTQACRTTGLELAFLARLDRAADELAVVAATPGSGLASAGDRARWSSSLCCALMSTGLRRVDDVQALPEVADLGRQHGLRAVLSEPVYSPSGELFGTLCAGSAGARPLGEADSAAMRLLAGLVSGKAPAGSGDAAAGRRDDKRVVVIDDDLVMQQLVAATLSTAGSMQLVGMAGTDAGGIALAAAQQPDVIVLDFELPDLSAAAVLDRVRALSRRSRVVLYSGRDDIHAIGQRLGVDRSVSKGDGIDRLHEALAVL